MAKMMISCPGCGYGREVEGASLPADRIKVTCPRCKAPFVFDRTAAPSKPPVQPPEPITTQAPVPAARPATARVTCPGCGYFKDIPADKVPDPPRDIKCPKCALGFPFGKTAQAAPAKAPLATPPPPVNPPEVQGPPRADETPPPLRKHYATQTDFEKVAAPAQRRAPARQEPAAGLTEIGELFSYAWDVYKRRVGTLVGLMLLSSLLLLVVAGAFTGIGYLLSGIIPGGMPVAVGGGAALGLVAGILAATVAMAGFFFAVTDEELGIGAALSAGRLWLWPFVWINMLIIFLVLGGYFFVIIPGLVFMFWFSLSPFVLAEEGETGMNALLKSREYIIGEWPGVLFRLFVIWLALTVMSAIPFIGPVLSLLATPFAYIYVHRVYLNLKAVRGDAPFEPTTREKVKWIGVSAFGYVFIPLLVVLFTGSYMAKTGLSLDQLLDKAGFNLGSISAPSIKLSSGKGGELEEVFVEYRAALDKGDMDDIKSRVSADVAKQMDGPGASMMLGMMQAFVPKQVAVTGADISGDTGTLYVEAEQQGGIITGAVSFVREGGVWKVAKEDWSMNVRPKKVKLSGGKSAPEFEPLGQDYVSPPMNYGMDFASEFYNKDDKPKLLATLTGHEDAVSGVAFVLGGARLVSSSYSDYTVRLWDIASGTELGRVKLENRPTSLAVTPDGDMAVLTDAYGGLTFLEVGHDGFGKGVRAAADLGNNCMVAASPNGKLLATAGFSKLVTVWDVASKKELRRIETPEPMRSVTFSPSGDVIAAGSATNKLTLWDLGKGEGRTYTADKVGKDSDLSSVSISPDSKYVVAGLMDSSIIIWDYQTQKELFNFYVTDASASDAKFSPDGKVFATAHANDEIYIWEPSSARKLMTITGQKGFPVTVAFSPEGSLMASAGADKSINIWGGSLSAANTMGAAGMPGGMPVSVDIQQGGQGQAGGASVWLDRSTFAPGEPVSVHFTAPAGYSGDAWIGIIPSEVAHGSEAENDRHDLTYQYLGGRTSGTLTFSAPASPGLFDFRMHDTDADGKEVSYAPFTVGQAGTPSPPPAPAQPGRKGLSGSPARVSYRAPAKLDSVMVYIYSINYKGTVRFNGKEHYVIKGERDMNYNATDYATPANGPNRFEVDYQALPDPWMTELKIRVYVPGQGGNDTVIAEWVINDASGHRTLDLDLSW